jgi:hypothetical protein
LDEEDRQKEVEAVENEEEHIEDQPDGASTAKSKNSTLENVSSRKFKRKQRNEIEETEFKLLNEMTKRLAQKENASRKEEDDEDKLFLLSFVKEIKKIPEDNKLDAKSEIIQTIKKWQKTAQQTYLHFSTNHGNLRHFTPLSTVSPASEQSYESFHSSDSSL